MSEPDPYKAALTYEERALDRQPLPNEDRIELEQLGQYVTDLYIARDLDDVDYEGWPEYFETLLAGLPILTDEDLDRQIDLAQFPAAPIKLKAEAGNRKYELELHIHNNFDGLAAKVQAIAQRMLDQAVKDQTRCFFERAKRKGLTWRRSRNLPFPHPLPYRNPAPTTNEGRYQEEAAVVTAAMHFACTRPTPTKLFIDHFAENNRVLGSAVVNLYHRSRLLRIKLNATPLGNGPYSNATWASVVAHEILHNLGWGHPRGSYPASLAIEIYQHCIKGTGDGFVKEEELLNFIR